MKRPSFSARLLLLAFLLILVVFGALLVRKYRTAPPSEPVPVAAEQEPKQLREVLLYFGAADGVYLAAEAREIEDCLVEEDCVRATVQALVDGPVGDLVPVLPSHAVLRAVATAEDEGTVTVDFSRELVTGHPGGSVSELLTVYGLANTLAENFPHLRQVRILVEGESAETIKGHVDLREPVQADFTFSRPSGGTQNDGAGAAGGPMPPTGLPGRSE